MADDKTSTLTIDAIGDPEAIRANTRCLAMEIAEHIHVSLSQDGNTYQWKLRRPNKTSEAVVIQAGRPVILRKFTSPGDSPWFEKDEIVAYAEAMPGQQVELYKIED